MKKILKRAHLVYQVLPHLVTQGKLIPSGKEPSHLTSTQNLFIQWNADQKNISIAESKKRYFESWKQIRNGHGGPEFRFFCTLSQDLYSVFCDDSRNEVMDTYRFHEQMHFLRQLSHPEPVWSDDNLLVRHLSEYSEVTILDFGCGLAHQSRSLASHLVNKDIHVNLVLTDIPTIRKEFLIWQSQKNDYPTRFLDCTEEIPVPNLPKVDVCIVTEFFEHVHDPIKYFSSIHAALNANGFILTNIADHEKEFMHVTPNLAELRGRFHKSQYKELITNELYLKSN